jgi:hypothetical protein
MTAATPPAATATFWTSLGRLNSDSASAQTTPTTTATASMIAASRANATIRVTSPP